MIGRLHRAAVIADWLQATDAAISALRSFRGCLVAWGNGHPGPLDAQALDLALALLDAGGLSEWAEECPAGGGLDALAVALGLPGAQLVPIDGDGDGQAGEPWGNPHQVVSS